MNTNLPTIQMRSPYHEVVLFKLYLTGYFFGMPSERKLFREVQVNLAYRWYLGCDLDEEIPDHSIITKSRYCFPVEGLVHLLNEPFNCARRKDWFRGTTITNQFLLSLRHSKILPDLKRKKK